MKNICFPYRWVLVLALSLGTTTSCFDALNLQPKYGLNALKVYADPANYINVLAKIYGGLSLSGNAGPAGQGGRRDKLPPAPASDRRAQGRAGDG